MDIQYFLEVSVVIMPLLIPLFHSKFLILLQNTFPYLKLMISACPSNPRSIERLKNHEHGLIYERI